MRSNGFAPCRVFEPRRSAALCRLVAATHALAFLAVGIAQLPWSLRIPMWLALGLSGYRAWTRHATRSSPRAVVRLERHDDGRWSAQRRDGTSVIGTLVDDSFIHRALVVVGIADGGLKTFVAVPSDALGADDHRRLRVWVKWQPATNRDAKSVAPTVN